MCRAETFRMHSAFRASFGYDENKCEHSRGDSKYNRCYHEADRLTDACVENTHEITSNVMLYTIFYRIVVTLSSIFGGKYEIFSVKYFRAQYPAGSRSQGACRIAFFAKNAALTSSAVCRKTCVALHLRGVICISVPLFIRWALCIWRMLTD